MIGDCRPETPARVPQPTGGLCLLTRRHVVVRWSHSHSELGRGKSIRMALYAELHRHLGGLGDVPRIFWRYLVRNEHPLAERYREHEAFEEFFFTARGRA